MEMMLQTKNLCKSFKHQEAVHKVSLNVEKGKVYGLLGPNGAGKSTTLKMLTGILKPSSGEIYFDGKPWSRNILSEIGALIENPPIYDNLSAWENLKVRALLLGVEDDRISEVLKIVSLTNTGKKRAGQFSLGMKQRLGIAAAIYEAPELILLDEPTNGLDEAGREQICGLLRKERERGALIVLASHDSAILETVSDEIYSISGGRIKELKRQ